MGRPRKGGGNDDRRIVFDENSLRELHGEGKTIAEIASIHGCSTHPVKMALKRMGLSRPAKRRDGMASGNKNPSWKGGRRIRPDGYIAIWTPNGERLEHQVVMEQSIGMAMRDGDVVHHIDGNKANNAPENLRLTTQSEHIREHLADMHAARYGK